MDANGKQKKIMKEIENLTPYLSELQEFKERGLFLPPNTPGNAPRPIFDEQGRRIDSASKEKRKTKAEEKAELRAKAFKVRVLAINKWLDDRFDELYPHWAIKFIRKYPHRRGWIMAFFFTKVEIVHSSRPVPFGSDIVTIKCFWAKYNEVKFVWEK